MTATHPLVWCPYTGDELPDTECNYEHIIPLSLGGSDGFGLRVSATINSTLGSEVDASLANDFLTLFRRREYDARGHSGKQPEVVVKHAELGPDNRPVQVVLDPEGMKIWDPRQRRLLSEPEVASTSLRLKVSLTWFNRLRFLAKVALSGGYFVFGERFRTNADHNALRGLMRASTPEAAASAIKHSGLRGHFEFSESNARDSDLSQVFTGVCKLVPGSCLIAGVGPANIVLAIGILGKWIGTLNVPADTATFPVSGDHEKGHLVVLSSGRMQRSSLHAFLPESVSK